LINGQIDFVGIFSAVTMMERLWQLQHTTAAGISITVWLQHWLPKIWNWTSQ